MSSSADDVSDSSAESESSLSSFDSSEDESEEAKHNVVRQEISSEDSTSEDDSSSSASFAESSDSDDSGDDGGDDDDDGRKDVTIPPGISADAYKTFYSKPADDDDDSEEEKKNARKGNSREERERALGMDPSTAFLARAEAENLKRMEELSMSQHSLKSCEELLETISTDGLLDDIDDTPLVDDIDIVEESKHYKENMLKKPKSAAATELSLMREKRQARMAKVRERIQAKNEKKEAEEDAKKIAEFGGATNFDMSEDAQRARAYEWYTRMAMPNRDKMKERVAVMPASSGLTVEAVDLLPWNCTGSLVNVAKMQSFLNKNFKKKFATTRRSTKAKDDSDSD